MRTQMVSGENESANQSSGRSLAVLHGKFMSLASVILLWAVLWYMACQNPSAIFLAVHLLHGQINNIMLHVGTHV